MFAQRRLSEMPRAERDSLLVKWAKEEQQGLHRRKIIGFQDVIDSVVIDTNLWSFPTTKRPNSELYHRVILYNKEAVKSVKYDFVYTLWVTFYDEDGATMTLRCGSGIGPILEDRVPRYHAPKRPKEKRKGLGVEEFQP